MKLIVALFLTFVVMVVGSYPASAHRPYYTQVEKIRLPNGDIGEARLLNGDGIFGPDPVRVLILDTQGRLLARSPKSSSIRISCLEGGECVIFDLTHDKVLELEASSFRQGDRVPGVSTEERDGLWDLEDGGESWGFRIRSPLPSERPATLSAMLREHFPMILINVLTGIVCGSLAIGAWLIVRAQRRKRATRILMAMAGSTVVAVVGLFAALASGFLSAISALPLTMWVLSLSAGGLSAVAGYCALRVIGNSSAPDARSIP